MGIPLGDPPRRSPRRIPEGDAPGKGGRGHSLGGSYGMSQEKQKTMGFPGGILRDSLGGSYGMCPNPIKQMSGWQFIMTWRG